MIRLIPVLMLSCCTHPVAPVATTRITLAEELRSCPHAIAAVPVPKPPRSFEVAIEWGRRTEAARAATAVALEECRAKLERVVGMIDATQRTP